MSRYLKPGPAFELAEGVEVQAKRSKKLGHWENAIVLEVLAGELPIVRFRDGETRALKPSNIRSRHPKPDPLRPLSKRDLARAPVPSRAEIRGALRQGAEELRAATQSRGRPFTPGGTARPKRPPLRSPAYLAFVREQPCCVCRAPAPSDPHHFGPRGIGQKTDDRRTAPLCADCHRCFHDTGSLPGLSRVEAECVLYRAQVDLLLRHADEERAVG